MRKPRQSASIPAPGTAKRGEEGYLGYLLRQASAAYRLRMERALSDLDVTPPQFAVLTMLTAYSELSNADLARLTLLTPQTVSVIVTNLERAGTITRRPHAVHGRILQITVSEKGRRLLAECRRRVHALEAELTTPLTREQEQTIRQWLVNVTVANQGTTGFEQLP